MADMDHDSYWHGYLMARHHTFLFLGTVLMVMALISTLTGRCLVKYQGIINRAEDPRTFCQNVALHYLLSLLSLGLYLYTANSHAATARF
jgi:heme/copper-type cytochrome/quinol oxidase subunit 2